MNILVFISICLLILGMGSYCQAWPFPNILGGVVLGVIWYRVKKNRPGTGSTVEFLLGQSSSCMAKVKLLHISVPCFLFFPKYKSYKYIPFDVFVRIK